MIQQFYKNTIESNFIKALLSNFNFPIYKSVNDDNDYIIKDCQYIYRNKVILCTKTGNINKDAEFEKVADYHMGQKYTGMTYPYISTERYYDYETHYYLGRYLRLIRDLLDIDLMPFYNCFSNRIVSDFYLTSDGYEFGYNPKYTVYLVPIELNTEYTIAIESAESVYLKPVFYNEMGMIPMYATSGYMTDLLNASTIVKQSLRFNTPFNIIIKSDNKLCEHNYKNLYLAIQVPMNTKSSIVVLEGSYNEFANNSLKVINQEAFKSDNFSIDDHQLNKILLSELQLLNLNDGKSYPFSDRLIEYLLLNVITSDDAIDRNIARTQLYISNTSMKRNIGSPSINIKENYDKVYSVSSVGTHNVGDFNGHEIGVHLFTADIDISKDYLLDFMGYRTTIKFDKLKVAIPTESGYMDEDTGLYYYGLVKYKGNFYEQNPDILPYNNAALYKFGLLVDGNDISLFIDAANIVENFAMYKINYGEPIIIEGKPVYTLPKFLGSWSPKIRYALYNIYMNNGENLLDINGFVDKCMEKLITKGFDV